MSLFTLVLTAWMFYPAPAKGASSLREQVETAGRRLMSEQRCKGPSAGFWPEEGIHAASIVADCTVAAFVVNPQNKAIGREGWMNGLAGMEGSTVFLPVRVLRVAVWALAGTGALDHSAVDPSGNGRSYWRTTTLGSSVLAGTSTDSPASVKPKAFIDPFTLKTVTLAPAIASSQTSASMRPNIGWPLVRIPSRPNVRSAFQPTW